LQAEEIFAAYPKQIARPAALHAIQRAIRQHGFAFVLERTRLYAQTYKGDLRFVPHPVKWFREQRYNDNPATWNHSDNAAKPLQLPRQFNPEAYRQDPTTL
jgi:hypothetical protein